MRKTRTKRKIDKTNINYSEFWRKKKNIVNKVEEGIYEKQGYRENKEYRETRLKSKVFSLESL